MFSHVMETKPTSSRKMTFVMLGAGRLGFTYVAATNCVVYIRMTVESLVWKLVTRGRNRRLQLKSKTFSTLSLRGQDKTTRT
jgi:hypothetical protein